VRIIYILLVSVFHHFILRVFSWLLNMEHRLGSCERILLGSHSPPHPPLIASSELHNLSLGSGPVPLFEGVDNPWVCPPGLTFGYLCQLLFLSVCVFLGRISAMLTVPTGGHLT
jgi:hypothetical protein